MALAGFGALLGEVELARGEFEGGLTHDWSGDPFARGAYSYVAVGGGNARAADGVIRAFMNSCRHRGARVCPEAAGTAAKLVCPYHQWTYQLDGRLFAARQMGPGFDRSRLALKSVHCEVVAGYIFVCLAAEAPDFGPPAGISSLICCPTA